MCDTRIFIYMAKTTHTSINNILDCIAFENVVKFTNKLQIICQMFCMPNNINTNYCNSTRWQVMQKKRMNNYNTSK